MKCEVIRRKKVTRDMMLADVKNGQAFRLAHTASGRPASCSGEIDLHKSAATEWWLRLCQKPGVWIEAWNMKEKEADMRSCSFAPNCVVLEVGEVELKIIVEEE